MVYPIELKSHLIRIIKIYPHRIFLKLVKQPGRFTRPPWAGKKKTFVFRWREKT